LDNLGAAFGTLQNAMVTQLGLFMGAVGGQVLGYVVGLALGLAAYKGIMYAVSRGK